MGAAAGRAGPASITSAIAASSAAARAATRGRRRSASRRARVLVDQLAVLGVDEQQRAEPGGRVHRRPRAPSASRCAELVDAGVEQEALEPEHARPRAAAPRSAEVARARRRPRTRRRPRPARRPPRAWSSSAATVVVGGIEFSGMSTSVVTPPAAAARVAVAKPSHSVRPGSLTWTWVSTRPGSSTSSSSRSTTRAGGRRLVVRRDGRDPTAARRRPPTATSAPSTRRAGRGRRGRGQLPR